MTRPANLPGPPAGARTLAALGRLSQAEDFFDFFELEYEPRVVQVYRLHVLRRFALEVDLIDRTSPMAGEQERLSLYRDALMRSHDLFTRSTAQEQKLFRVFQDGAVVTLGRRR